jgi:chromosome segregation ATPase
MITRIRLTNFQLHKKIVIELDPKITTIVGPSDVGKSAIFRALRWIARNRPSGTSLIRKGAKYGSASVYVDGNKITRHRSRSDNSYRVKDRKGQTEQYRAFGHDLPISVPSLLSLTDSNFQGQYDSFYWLSLSAAQVSRELNEVVDLDSLDRAMTHVASRLRESTAKSKVCRERLEAAREGRKLWHWAISADRRLKRLEALNEKIAHQKLQIARLRRLIEQGESIKAARDRWLTTQITASEAASASKKSDQLSSRVDRLRNLIQSGDRLRSVIDSETPSQSTIDRASRYSAKVAELRTKITKLGNEIAEAEKQKEMIKCHEQKLSRVSKQLSGRSCPTCGQKIRSLS